jgi:hypothetical protein
LPHLPCPPQGDCKTRPAALAAARRVLLSGTVAELPSAEADRNVTVQAAIVRKLREAQAR